MDLRAIKLNMPVPVGSVVTQSFGENPQVYARFGQAGHNGIDYGVATGTEVRAAADGIVEKIGYDADGYGVYVKIDHGEFITLYAHLSQALAVKNDKVWAGEVIGLSGSSGFSTGAHVHFELRTPGAMVPGYPQGARDASPFFVAQPAPQVAAPDPHTLALLALRAVECSIPQAHDQRLMSVSARRGANIRLSPGGRIVGALAYGSGLVEARGFADPSHPGWLPVVCWVHASVVTDE